MLGLYIYIIAFFMVSLIGRKKNKDVFWIRTFSVMSGLFAAWTLLVLGFSGLPAMMIIIAAFVLLKKDTVILPFCRGFMSSFHHKN